MAEQVGGVEWWWGVGRTGQERRGLGYGRINTNTSEYTSPTLAARGSDVCSNNPSLRCYSACSASHTFCSPPPPPSTLLDQPGRQKQTDSVSKEHIKVIKHARNTIRTQASLLWEGFMGNSWSPQSYGNVLKSSWQIGE